MTRTEGETGPQVEPGDAPASDDDRSLADVAPPAATTRRGGAVLGWVITIVVVLVVSAIVRTFLVQVFWIPSESMVPTLAKGDRVAIEKVADAQHPSRGDVIVFSKPPGLIDPTVNDLIKRVIGLPGESIVIEDNHVFIDGRQLVEPYLPAGTVTANVPGWTQCTTRTPCVVPDGHVWVMGDNREHSEDSRAPQVGPIEESTIAGRAFVILWPPSRWSGL